MARTRRRSLLNKRSPVPAERLVRTPAGLQQVNGEDAPLAPRIVPRRNSPALTPVSPSGQRIPPDPSLVEFDLSDHELPELPHEAFDLLEELPEREAETHAKGVHEISTEDAHPVPRAPILALPSAPDPTPVPIVALMAATFTGAAAATMIVVLLPWFVFVSPSLDASRQARRAAPQPEKIDVAVPKAPVLAVSTPSETVADPVPAEDAETPELPAVAPVAPSTPVVAKTPRRVPPEVKTDSANQAESPEVPKVEAAPKAKPVPEVVDRSSVPEQARVLAGTLSGTADGAPVSIRFQFLPNGRLKSRITRAGKSRNANGSYSVAGKRATFALKEAGTGVAYSGTINAAGASGRVTQPDGSRGRLKVRR